MHGVLDKIRADAETRLHIPEGKPATSELARFKSYLKLETHRLKLLHRAGASGRELCQARAFVVDLVLQSLWRAAIEAAAHHARAEPEPLALVALGGYGRAELNPHSDIDIVFLHAGKTHTGPAPGSTVETIVRHVLYPLWDMGLKVSHTVHNVDECVRLARRDMRSKTSMLEARLVAGDPALFEQFERAILEKCVIGHEEEFLKARLADQAERRQKFGNSACMQEPNIKNGCGGLRDYQNLLWMAWFKYRVRTLEELEARGFITATERKQLDAAYDFLLRVRTEMHYHANRPVDTLTKNLQPAVAYNLGFKDRSPSQRIEKFMRVLYTHMRNIHLLSRTLEQRMALSPADKPRLPFGRLFGAHARATAKENVFDGFRLTDGQIVHESNRVFRDQPRRLMRVFMYAQQRRAQLHPDLVQLIRTELRLANRAFAQDPHVADTFLNILRQRGSVAPALRAMHEVGLLGKYIPEFGRLTCLVQHEFYHQYAADEHTLKCIEQLDGLCEAKHLPHAEYGALFRNIERPELLYLALLLHDTGKGLGHGNHVEQSCRLALRVARRLGLDTEATHTLHKLIAHHLDMARMSQLRDLADPAVIRHFARLVETPASLAALAVLTFADAQATSDRLWNSFKNSLLWRLYRKTLDALLGGGEYAQTAQKRREALMAQVRQLMPTRASQQHIQTHFDSLDARYFEAHTANEIAEDVRLARRFIQARAACRNGTCQPIVLWRSYPDRGCSAAKVCTGDRPGLFSKIAGSFSAVGLNILSAQVFTRTDGVVLDTFYVVDAQTGGLATQSQRQQFDTLLARVLADEPLDLASLIAQQKRGRSIYQSYEGERIPTRIELYNDASDVATVIEIETEDRLGLLYALSRALSELGLNISAARICTEKGAAIDSFYVTELDGRKIVLAERKEQIQRALLRAIEQLDHSR
ncbi:MAG: [protein-PII] uridylyltransferase [Verrucomicrobiae bacterium]|nr:[protein-PII] uridylyltransferase [Verrucomicrobiae bacterium]